MAIVFWISIFIVFYTFLGYGIFLFFLVKLRQIFRGKRPIPDNKGNWPTVTLIVAAYNEQDYIVDKIFN
jgi:cellulose synthase/poly-beta-1,6-N-acetylglucosamine synthase-like glycosyltransferase